jgi:hypothetical protein
MEEGVQSNDPTGKAIAASIEYGCAEEGYACNPVPSDRG